MKQFPLVESLYSSYISAFSPCSLPETAQTVRQSESCLNMDLIDALCYTCWIGNEEFDCCFENIRSLVVLDNQVIGQTFISSSFQLSSPTHKLFFGNWDFPLADGIHIMKVKSSKTYSYFYKSTQSSLQQVTVQHLIPYLESEVYHTTLPKLLVQSQLPGVRIVCGLSCQYCLAFWLATHAIPQDVCMTSIFGSSWMCEQCGREICLECYQSLTSEVCNSTVKYCVHNQEHSQATFLPISRFQKSKLLNALEDMKSITRPDDLLW